MIYGNLRAEFMETKYNGHIHRYGTHVFGKIVVYISKPINNNNQILTSKAGHFSFLLHSLHFSDMEEV